MAALGLSVASVFASGYLDAPDSVQTHFHPFLFVAGGTNLNRTPHLGAFLEFQRSWQAGLEIRSWAAHADSRYDYWPEVDFHLRRLWLSDEDVESLRNSEYVDVGAGVFPAYNLNGDQVGALPQARIGVGKYWIPVVGWRGGLDVNIAFAHYFWSRPPGSNHVQLLTLAAAFFYRL